MLSKDDLSHMNILYGKCIEAKLPTLDKSKFNLGSYVPGLTREETVELEGENTRSNNSEV